MTITRQAESDNKGDWDAIITDADAEIQRLRRRIFQLKASIEMFRESRDSGKPLPDGMERTQAVQPENQTSEACHTI